MNDWATEELVPVAKLPCEGIKAAEKKGWAYSPPIGIGGAPTRPRTMPTSSDGRKRIPVAGGVLNYFPDAILAIAEVSAAGNEQHNPGKPLHWDRAKSGDEDEALMRHFMQRGTLDTDGLAHSAKMAWRAMALLQKEIEADLAKKANA